MLMYARPHIAYLFAVIAGIGLMLLEHLVSDGWMIVLICAALIAHVWLTRRAVSYLLIHQRQHTIHDIETIALRHSERWKQTRQRSVQDDQSAPAGHE